MRYLPRLILIALWPTLATADQALTSVGPLAYYVVERALEPVVIDGKLDEFYWSKSNQINNFERISSNAAQLVLPTRAKMLWDSEYFYFAFVCQDADMWASYENEDDYLWEEEVVEIFIDPDSDGKNYLELEVNPRNVVVDLLIYSVVPEWHSSVEWDITGLKTAVQAEGTVNDSLKLDRGWIAEIAIPWTAMADSITGGARPTSGDIWRLNLYRIERKGGRNLRAQITALQDRVTALNDQINTIWLQHDANLPTEERNMALLDVKDRQRLTALNEQLTSINEKLNPLQAHYRAQTDETAWSDPYSGSFHKPDRFGAVQFVE